MSCNRRYPLIFIEPTTHVQLTAWPAGWRQVLVMAMLAPPPCCQPGPCRSTASTFRLTSCWQCLTTRPCTSLGTSYSTDDISTDAIPYRPKSPFCGRSFPYQLKISSTMSLTVFRETFVVSAFCMKTLLFFIVPASHQLCYWVYYSLVVFTLSIIWSNSANIRTRCFSLYYIILHNCILTFIKYSLTTVNSSLKVSVEKLFGKG